MNAILKLIFAATMTIVVFVGLGVIGEYDWAEEVISHMSMSEYTWVKDTLAKQYGSEPSEREIANWWAKHHGDYQE